MRCREEPGAGTIGTAIAYEAAKCPRGVDKPCDLGGVGLHLEATIAEELAGLGDGDPGDQDELAPWRDAASAIVISAERRKVLGAGEPGDVVPVRELLMAVLVRVEVDAGGVP